MQTRGELLKEKNTRPHNPQTLAAPLDRETVTETKGTGSTGKGSLVATEEMDREDKGTEMVRAGKGPVVQVRAHSGSHCYISGPGQELGGHRGCLKSGISHLHHHISQTRKLLQAPN